ncbi:MULTISPECIES: sulfurtransferase complex subunit TusD [Shewanella]|uniref:Sulfurtransferase TusD n=1 Tax=Shewanella algae TaxID=38313 RepID=A0A380BU61_9GAMM|nr:MULTISPECIES: sulfurtransferase complex subunit TusD [Shewanella]MBO2607727.1 sulfurtransferase complex subunit TusD [Shewanella algae]MBO2620355.1 sulfurtransferase complex subunit TusD [Shewanella algae]MBO2679319.1 sulfurtransferase complex subunit TusD [Shewanella algae]MBO2696409.1 sulfurtransferase complex subunit TusD [Shewanella algae]MCE9775473.1 sulfurtransferase complex subunit TusD [Shewanella algae]
MSKLIIMVNGSIYGPAAGFHALKYTRAALQAGHEVHCVFFYQDGVSQSNALCAPASDELDLTAAWQQLAKEWQLNLVNCVSAALRRGVLSAQDAKDNAKASANLAAGFTMGGLGELVTGLEKSDRLVSF